MSKNCPYAWLERAAFEWSKAERSKPTKPRFQLLTNPVKAKIRSADQRAAITAHLYLVKAANAANEVRHA